MVPQCEKSLMSVCCDKYKDKDNLIRLCRIENYEIRATVAQEVGQFAH